MQVHPIASASYHLTSLNMLFYFYFVITLWAFSFLDEKEGALRGYIIVLRFYSYQVTE